MCMFNDTVDDVSSTNLFACLDTTRTRQLLIYSNNVDNKIQSNAMVLPVPHPDSVVFHDMTTVSNFFLDLQKCFYKLPSRGYDSLGWMGANVSKSEKLEVYDVGSYFVSIVPSVNDFSRLQSETFNFQLSINLKKILVNYDSVFGFLVCQLKIGNIEYKPLAYSHRLFNSNELFYPTFHYHFHTSFPSHNHSETEKTIKNDMVDDWDHLIYTPNMVSVNMPVDHIDKSIMNPYFGNIKIGFDFQSQYNDFYRVKITGEHPNKDVIIKCN